MFDGERTTVELFCHEDAMNSVLDHFGENAKTRMVDDTHFLLTTEVSLSPTFFAWVFQFGGKVKIWESPRFSNSSRIEEPSSKLSVASFHHASWGKSARR